MQITDEQVFEKLFRKYYADLCNYAGRFIFDQQVAEDIVQNYFITIWEKGQLPVTDETFLPYSYRAIKNSCINHYKLEIIRDDFYSTLTLEWKKQLEEQQEEESDFIHKKEVQAALRKLPEKCRNVFLLKCVTGLKYKEIAELSGISVNTVKYHLGEAFRIMREELKNISFLLFPIFF